MKIVFFGDSLTQGTLGVNYVDKVAAMLRGHHFINEGVNGDTSLNLYRRVDEAVIARRPDGVFIMVGINDALSHADPHAHLYYRLVKRVAGGRLSPIAFRENLRATLNRILVEQIRVWVALPPIEYSPESARALRQMNDYALQICTELNIPTLDLMQRLTPPELKSAAPLSIMALMRQWSPVRNYDRWRDEGGYTYTFDGIHLTEAGAQHIAEAVAAFLHENGVNG